MITNKSSDILQFPQGHAFIEDAAARHGVKMKSNADRVAILDEHHRIMSRSGAQIAAVKKAAVSPRLAAARAKGKRCFQEFNARLARVCRPQTPVAPRAR